MKRIMSRHYTVMHNNSNLGCVILLVWPEIRVMFETLRRVCFTASRGTEDQIHD